MVSAFLYREKSRFTLARSGHGLRRGCPARDSGGPCRNERMERTSATEPEQRGGHMVPREGTVWLQRSILDDPHGFDLWHGPDDNSMVHP